MQEFYLACKSGDLEKVKSIVSAGLNETLSSSDIVLAIENGHLEVMEYLKNLAPDDILNRLLYIAVKNGHLPVIKYLISVGADSKIDDDFLIGIASENGHLDVVKYLVSQGGNVRGKNDYAIIYASDNGHLDVVKYLVSQGADYGNPFVVMWASASGHLDVVKYLFDLDPELDLSDSLQLSSETGHLDVVEFLLEKSGDWGSLMPKHQKYFTSKFAYKKWRRIHLRNWIRKILTPLYYSPQFQGGIQAKKELENTIAPIVNQNEK